MTVEQNGFWTTDSDDVSHVHGDHWGVFLPDVEEAIAELIQATLQQGTVWIDGRDKRAAGLNRAAILRLVMPEDLGYSVALIEMGEAENNFASMWPLVEAGIGTHRLRLQAGFVWSNGMEGQLEAAIGPSVITFFDHRFLQHAGEYREGLEADFHLCIHAYILEPADTQPIVMTDPNWPGREFMHGDDPDDPDSPITIQTKGLGAFFQLNRTDRDDCEFRGPVKAVRQLEHPVFGQPTWLVTVTVLRDTDADDEDVDMDIVLTEIVLGDHPLPQVGDDVQGTGWVQGWMAG